MIGVRRLHRRKDAGQGDAFVVPDAPVKVAETHLLGRRQHPLAEEADPLRRDARRETEGGGLAADLHAVAGGDRVRADYFRHDVGVVLPGKPHGGASVVGLDDAGARDVVRDVRYAAGDADGRGDYGRDKGHEISPRRIPSATASARSLTPRLTRMLLR